MMLTKALIFSFAILLFSCEKNNNGIGDIPKITFAKYIKSDDESTLKLIINYEDGDGDLGLKDEDTLPPFNAKSKYYTNLHIKYLELLNDTFKEVTLPFPAEDDTINYNYRFPYITPDGNNKNIKGDLEVSIPYSEIAPGAANKEAYDGFIKFKIVLYDRALHESNTVSSPEIAWKGFHE